MNTRNLTAIPAMAVLMLAAAPLHAGDTLLTNGVIHTVDAENPQAEAMVLDGKTIEFVGSAEEARGYLENGSNIIDLAGQFVMPAPMDSHTHPGLVALIGSKEGGPVLPGESKEALFDFLKKFAKENPDLPFVMLGPWDVRLFAPEGPDRADLDAIFPDTPVLLNDSSGHSVWVNTAMFEMLGVDENTPDLSEDLSYFVRDENGRMTGWVKEFALFPYMVDMMAKAPENMQEQLGFYFDYLISHGVTTIMDAGTFGWGDLVYGSLAKMEKAGKLPLRYEGTYHIYSPEQLEVAVDEVLRLRKEFGGERLTFNTIKIHLDGVNEINTAGVLEDFANEPGNRGGILFSSDELMDLMREMSKHDIHLHMHSVGDRTTRTVLDAVEKLRAENGGKPLPIQITLAHLELVDPTDIARFKDVSVNANFTPHWLGGTIFAGSDVSLGKERMARNQVVRSFFDAGANVTFSSDVVSMPTYERSNPFLGIQMGATRQEAEIGRDAPIFAPESARATVAQMIEGYTLNNAVQMGLDDKLGSLQAGKLADFVILPENLLEMDVYDIHKVVPTAVYMNGELVFDSDTVVK
ncbi:MAG: hypothetical protein CSB44_08905 [Gammaproteobacteria bacterium]|nr:MAG: hypothetical protein CSB44_08905 [Gammaproteobacteria bacterium]